MEEADHGSLADRGCERKSHGSASTFSGSIRPSRGVDRRPKSTMFWNLPGNAASPTIAKITTQLPTSLNHSSYITVAECRDSRADARSPLKVLEIKYKKVVAANGWTSPRVTTQVGDFWAGQLHEFASKRSSKWETKEYRTAFNFRDSPFKNARRSSITFLKGNYKLARGQMRDRLEQVDWSQAKRIL